MHYLDGGTMKEDEIVGIFQQEETHESQSSSMSYALRWKHESVRQLLLAALGAIAITLLILLVVHNRAGKEIQLVVDGRVTTVETHGSLLQEVLDEQAITLAPQDNISMPLNGLLKDGDRVIIERAVPVKVTADGKTRTIFTTQDTVGSVLKEAGISIKGEDKVSPSTDTKVSDSTAIRVVRVTRQTTTVKENKEFRVIKTADPSLVKGDNRVIQSGKDGILVKHIEKVYEDGKLVSKEVVKTEVESKTKDKVIAVGTKKVPEPEPEVQVASAKQETAAQTTAKTKTTAKTTTTAKTESTKAKTTTTAAKSKADVKTTAVSASNKDNVLSRAGIDFEYKKVLNNVSMTAYSSEQPGIGTRTASGTRVTEGRTIAVDPNVIPIGWWVYIEGLGFRRAEDTGGAIKGNKVDVYYDSLKAAINFGRKSGRTVYVIGPVKPEAN